MARSRGKMTVVVCRSMESPLRHFLSAHLTEVAPLVFAGRMTRKAREFLLNALAEHRALADGSMVSIVDDPSMELGFTAEAYGSIAGFKLTDWEGLPMTTRRTLASGDPTPSTPMPPEPWESILGKTRPHRYPLVRHLLDSAAVAEVLWTQMLAPRQRTQVASRLFPGAPGAEEDVLQVVRYAAGMHDIGKATPFWQASTLHLDGNDPSLAGLPWPQFTLADATTGHDIQGAIYGRWVASQLPGGPPSPQGRLLTLLQQVAAGHHGNFKSANEGAYASFLADRDTPEEPVWLGAQGAIEAAVLQHALGLSERPSFDALGPEPEGILLLTGLVILADWVASQESFIAAQDPSVPLGEHHRHALVLAERFVGEQGLSWVPWAHAVPSWGQVHPALDTPNAMQSVVAEAVADGGAGFLFISAPMGMGKTEAALHAAASMGAPDGSGIYFALPTMDTATAIFDRVALPQGDGLSTGDRLFKGRHSVALLHSNSLVARSLDSIDRQGGPRPTARPPIAAQVDMDAGSAATSAAFISDYLVERKVGGFSTLAVGTIDPLLSTVVRLKHNALRWLSISGKVLVLDEVHSFDPYTTTLIRELVGWAARLDIPVICMTATMVAGDQHRLARAYAGGLRDAAISRAMVAEIDTLFQGDLAGGLPSPGVLSLRPRDLAHPVAVGIPEVDGPSLPSPNYTVDFLDTGAVENGLADAMASSIASEFGGVHDRLLRLVVMNRVEDSITVARRLRELLPGVPVGLVHARMPQVMRDRVVAEALALTGKTSTRRGPHILVATQVVESSLDLDFDELHTPLAPLEALLQRAGRVFRHANPHRDAAASARVAIHLSREAAAVRSRTGEEERNPFLPYAPWSLAVALQALGTVTQEGAVVVSLKDRIGDLYAAIFGADGEPLFPDLHAPILAETRGKEHDAGNQVVEVGSRLGAMTSLHTERSSARSPVRLMSPTEQVLPVVQVDGEWCTPGEDGAGVATMDPLVPHDSLGGIRFHAAHLVTLPAHAVDKLEEAMPKGLADSVRVQFHLPEHVHPVTFPSGAHSVGLDGFGFSVKGL